MDNEIKLTKEQAQYIATWIVEESERQAEAGCYDVPNGAWILQAADAWNGGAR